jgi:iron complex transport system substrate-binding protein
VNFSNHWKIAGGLFQGRATPPAEPRKRQDYNAAQPEASPYLKMISVFCLVLLAFVIRTNAAPTPPRLVSLSPNLTELVYALGLESNLVGRSSACDQPSSVKTLPIAGDFGRPNVEQVQLLKPNFLLVTDLEKPGLVQQMKAVGIEVKVLPCESWNSLLDAAAEIAKLCGAPAAGEKWIAQMTARRAELEQEVETFFKDRPRPRVYMEIWSDPITTVGGATFGNDMILLAGGQNIGAGLKQQYAHVSSEWIIQQNPDIIVLAWMKNSTPALEAIMQRPGWAGIRAVKERQVIADIDPDWLLRSGPRMILGAEALAERFMSPKSNVQSPKLKN